VYEQGSQVRIALLADATETAALTGGVLARGEPQPAGEVARCGEALDIDNRCAQRGGGERPDARDLHEAFNDRIMCVQACQLAVDVFTALLQRVDLCEQFKQARVQQRGDRTVEARECFAYGPDRTQRADGHADSELAQAATQEVNPCSSSCHPLRAQPMQLLKGLLINGLDRYRSNVKAARRFDECRGIRRVGLVAPDVGAGVLRR
jgi:hypothetical protein